MSSFIHTPKGLLNLDQVQTAERTNKGKYRIIVDGEVIDQENDFEKTIVSIIPVQGDWECLMPCEEEDGSESALICPIIAWGLTATGYTIPITPFDMGGVEGEYAKRKSGDTRVYDLFGQVHENADEWIADRAKQDERLKVIR